MAQPCYAVVDLETTGNQIQTDEIIQIGITFVKGDVITGTYQSLIKTDITIPPFISALTSIDNESLANAPYFHEIKEQILKQLQGCIFVAHNADFDLKFLKASFEACNMSFEPYKVIDTMELFKIAFPTAKSYQLGELASALDIPLDHAHQADEDAKTTALIMLKSFDKFKNLPLDSKKQLYYLSKALKYDLKDYFFELIRHSKEIDISKDYGQFEQLIYKKQVDLKLPKFKLPHTLKDIYALVVERLNLNYRSEQLYLAETIFEQLLHNEKALIEAELGSGKSLAYLLAALLYNHETDRHVMISTNTKLLQNQLLHKDIPLLNEALGINVNAALIKSKNDYISLGLISQILKDETHNYEVSLLKAQLLIWITETETGDIHELNLKGGQKVYFEQKVETYVPVPGDIHYYNYIKRNAKHIQIGVTNHAHLLHQSNENSIYHLFDDCIIDEAHRLPDYALNQVLSKLTYSDIKYQLGLIGKNENEKLLQKIDELEQKRIFERIDIPPIDVFGLKIDINELHELTEDLFDHMLDIIHTSHIYDDESNKFHYAFEFNPSPLIQKLTLITHKINHILEYFNGMSHKTIKTTRKQLLYINDQFKQVLKSLKANHTSFIAIKNVEQKSTIELMIKDHSVKDILSERIIDKFNALTLISGTLTFNESFEHFKKWFHNEHTFNAYIINTKMKRKHEPKLFIPSDIESYDYSNIDGYVMSIVNYIVEYVNTTQDKCLVLFTSYKMLYMVNEYLNEMPELSDYVILHQQQSQNNKIVNQFNKFDKSILLGTNTFFEGFDFQSKGIKCVMIAKLPFMNQKHTKYWLMHDEFIHIFKDYVLPDAVTRFRQGLGRLIRNEDDNGIVVSFDNRLIHSQYQQYFESTTASFDVINKDINIFRKVLKDLIQDDRNNS
ncbi:3'-5' exoribonuclease [Staphylococcus massiliensis]|uniref:helicase C-terminal domain-containing protein n=1 Tax=Staphylococcus massiliensis TaxID=555791 RepID=UPI001EE145BC|nr:helicase C-terminal domain-containing protein [Staphylococcus massiliensis]MCG3412244.1 3'-5' exoribonuclease [Staphylococcus massiliensis]